MADSTLTLDFVDLCKDAAQFAGYGIGTNDPGNESGWGSDSNKKTQIEDLVTRAIRRVVWCETGHKWSWFSELRNLAIYNTRSGTASTAVYASPSTTITDATNNTPFSSSCVGRTLTFTTSGAQYEIIAVTSTSIAVVTGDASGEAGNAFTVDSEHRFRLGDRFGGIVDDALTYLNSSSHRCPVQLTTEHTIREKFSAAGSNDTTGPPILAAVEPLLTEGSTNQRFDLVTWPKPDGEYTLQFETNVEPNKPTAASPVLPGSASMSELFTISTLGLVEKRFFERAGENEAEFPRALAAAIKQDQYKRSEKLFGDGNRDARRSYHGYDPLTTHEGLYSDRNA